MKSVCSLGAEFYQSVNLEEYSRVFFFFYTFIELCGSLSLCQLFMEKKGKFIELRHHESLEHLEIGIFIQAHISQYAAPLFGTVLCTAGSYHDKLRSIKHKSAFLNVYI